MASRVSKRLVVDVSIARAAGGEDAVYPVSKHCRDLLSAILRICHQLVMTREIYGEWRTHQSNFARKWRVKMLGARKVVIFGEVGDHVSPEEIDELNVGEGIKNILKKDILLINAAIAADKTIFSLDDTCRRHFSNATVEILSLRDVHWINPSENFREMIEWLENGAPSSEPRLLQHYMD